MKKGFKLILSFALVIMSLVALTACSMMSKNNQVAEKIELASATLGEIEFENSDDVKIKQDGNVVTITGKVDEMSSSQKMEFGVESVTHVVVLKFKFDKERTLDKFEIKGNTTKVYSTDESDTNYVGSITDLLENNSGEDAYTYLILSASTNEYKLTSTYSDETSSVITIKFEGSLASADAE